MRVASRDRPADAAADGHHDLDPRGRPGGDRRSRGGQPVRLTADMRAVVLEQRLGYHATVSPDGRPNLSPKGTTTVFDDEHLIFAHIRSPQTVANLRANPAIETNVVDPILRRGYRFRGRGTVYEAGEMYERGLAILAEHGYDADPGRIRAVVLITVEEALELRSPAYDDGSSAEEVASPWRARFRRRVLDEMEDERNAAGGARRERP